MLTGAAAGAAALVVSSGSCATEPPAGLNCRFILAGEDGAEALSASYNADYTRIPRMRAMPRDADAVAGLVDWIRDTGQAFAVRSGGHSFIGQGQHANVVIDLREMRRVAFDETSRLVETGGGATMGDLHAALSPRGLVVAGGTHPGAGAVGLGTGGGFGYFARRVGLLCDQFAEIEIVGADGNRMRASPADNPDLFWALQGGGAGSFGIVTRLRMRALDPGDINVVAVTVALPVARAFEALLRWLIWSETAPRHTTTHLTLQRHGETTVLLQLGGVAGGPRSEVIGTIDDITGSATPETHVRSGSVAEVAERLMPIRAGTAIRLISRSQLLAGAVDPTALAAVINTLMSNPAGTARINFEALGGATAEVATAGTAFPHRAARLVVHVQTSREVAPAGSDPDATVADLAGILAPYATGGVYVNYPEADREDWATAYWGTNLPRLRQIKSRYDPNNFFHHTQSIPPA